MSADIIRDKLRPMPKHGSINPRKPEGSLGRTAQATATSTHTAPELWFCLLYKGRYMILDSSEIQLPFSHISTQLLLAYGHSSRKDRKQKKMCIYTDLA